MTRPTREVENYTVPFLWAAALVVFIGLFTIWATFNFAMSLLTGFILHQVIKFLPTRD